MDTHTVTVEGSYILRPLRVVTRVRRRRLAAGEGRGSRRVVAEAVRSDLHVLTHTYTHLRTRVSVTAGAVTHRPAGTRGARGRRTSRREGGEDPRGLAGRRGCPVMQPWRAQAETWVKSTVTHAHLPMSVGTELFPPTFACTKPFGCQSGSRIVDLSPDTEPGWTSWTIFVLRYLGARALCTQSPSVCVRIRWNPNCPGPVRAKTIITRTV